MLLLSFLNLIQTDQSLELNQVEKLEGELIPEQPHEPQQHVKEVAIDELGMIGHTHVKLVNVVIHTMSLQSLDVKRA